MRQTPRFRPHFGRPLGLIVFPPSAFYLPDLHPLNTVAVTEEEGETENTPSGSLEFSAGFLSNYCGKLQHQASTNSAPLHQWFQRDEQRREKVNDKEEKEMK